MECSSIEERLSEYMDRSLPAAEMEQVAEHLQSCNSCVLLLEEMRAVLVTCKSFPVHEPDIALLERVLLVTSGRPRKRSFEEILRENFLRPMLTPRFAFGTVLALLFAVLLVNLAMPKATSIASILAPGEMLRQLDRGTQQLYSEGQKLYGKKNEWQAQFNFFKNNVINKLGFMIEKLDVPVDVKKKSGEEPQPEEKSPKQKSSARLLRT